MKYNLVKVNLNETTLQKMLTKHSDAGYIIITAFRTVEYSYQENVRRNNKLKMDINRSEYSYIPVWGGFVETDSETGRTQEVKERSFVVFNFKRGTIEPFVGSEGLKKLGMQLCKKYNQESFLYKPQGSETKSYYLTADGKVDMTFGSVSPTTDVDVYFTNLAKGKDDPIAKRAFTYREGVIWLPDSPKTMSEAYKRYGEVFLGLTKRKTQNR